MSDTDKQNCPIERAMSEAGRMAHYSLMLAIGRKTNAAYHRERLTDAENNYRHLEAAARAELAEKNAELARLRECVRLADEMLRSAVWTLKYDFITDGAQRTALQDVVNAYRAARRQS